MEVGKLLNGVNFASYETQVSVLKAIQNCYEKRTQERAFVPTYLLKLSYGELAWYWILFEKVLISKNCEGLLKIESFEF